MNEQTTKYKFKKFKKAKITREYALIFCDSNSMLDCVCDINTEYVLNSRLYTKSGTYQLVITTEQDFSKKLQLLKHGCTVFQDRFHIDEIKQKNHLICNKNAILKIQKSFKDS